MAVDDVKKEDMSDLSGQGQKPQPDAVLTQPNEIVGVDNAETTAKRVQVGIPFKKGDDPRRNLEGRKEGTKNWETYFMQGLKYLAELNGKEPEDFDIELISKYLEKGRKGDVRVLMNLFDRRFGKPKESIDHTTGGEKLNQKMEWVIVRGKKDEEHN